MLFFLSAAQCDRDTSDNPSHAADKRSGKNLSNNVTSNSESHSLMFDL